MGMDVSTMSVMDGVPAERVASGGVVMEAVGLLSYPVFLGEPLAAVGYVELLPYRQGSGVLALRQAREELRRRIPDEHVWVELLRALTRCGAVTLRGLRPYLAAPEELAALQPLQRAQRREASAAAPAASQRQRVSETDVASAQLRAARDDAGAWGEFMRSAARITRVDRRSYRTAIVKALRAHGFEVSESRDESGSRYNARIILHAERAGERAAITIGSASNLAAMREGLSESGADHLVAAVHPECRLIDLRRDALNDTAAVAAAPSAAAPSAPPRAARSGFDPLACELPSNVDPEVWREWVQHRSDIKKPLTATSTARQLKRLAAFGGGANEVIQTAIERGWRGLFFTQGDEAAPPVPRGTFERPERSVAVGDTVTVHDDSGATRSVVAMVVTDSSFLIDEDGNSYPWSAVTMPQAAAA